MPIRKEDYPKNWKEISKVIIQRANNICELCGAPNHMMIVRPKKFPQKWILKGLCSPYGILELGGRVTKVILTVHHINGNKMDNHPLNLIGLCQRCHLRLDLKHHMDNRRERREKGQMKLFKGGKHEN